MGTGNRLGNNIQIISQLSSLLMKYPDLRFGQLLEIYFPGGIDFNEESEKTLERLISRIQEIEHD